MGTEDDIKYGEHQWAIDVRKKLVEDERQRRCGAEMRAILNDEPYLPALADFTQEFPSLTDDDYREGLEEG